jgi:maltose alpha-D-glucosyltransferase/alpha-amylase
VSPAPRTTRWQGALEEALAARLAGFLPAQRWFGSKARRIASARADDTIWLRGGAEPCALIVARVEYTGAAPERYALLVTLRREPDGHPVLATLGSRGETRHVVESAGDGTGSLALLRHLGRAEDLPAVHGGTLSFGDLPADGAGALDAAALTRARVRPLGVEQSNSSFLVRPRHVFKLFRRLEPGESPEVEIGRFLATRTSFRSSPALRGSVTWRPADGNPGTVGALQDWVENLGDGWKWTLGALAGIFTSREGPETLVNEILTLGATTAELHAALASRADAPGFAPEPATSDDVRTWEDALRTRAAGVFETISEAKDAMDERTRGLCEGLFRLRGRADAWAGLSEPMGPAAFSKIRVHGDYHLGQTLKTRDGFVLIDFEGEPARPLAERRRPHCAAKDVAGMLRSFDYAIESARAALPEDRGGSAPAPPLRDAFLRGYEARAAELGGGFLPTDPNARDRLLRFFELDKAFYELEYEIQNRPAWLHIPAAGVLRLAAEAS